MEQWKSQLAALTAPQRVELAHFLINSLTPQEEGVEAAWEAEAARRLDAIRAGQVVGKPAAQVFAEPREKHS